MKKMKFVLVKTESDKTLDRAFPVTIDRDDWVHPKGFYPISKPFEAEVQMLAMSDDIDLLLEEREEIEKETIKKLDKIDEQIRKLRGQ